MKTRKFTKVLSVLLSVIMLASVFCCAASAESKELTINGEGSYELFNSGATSTRPQGDIPTNTAVDTFDNNGYDIYLNSANNEYQIGLSFTVNTKINKTAYVTILAFDVDEGPTPDMEHDYVYLVDEQDGTEVEIGMLSGMNQEWNTTSMQIDPSLLVKGHTYHFELVDSVYGWVVWVRTVTLVWGNSLNIKASLDSTINNGVVTNVVKYSTSNPDKYTFEFKAISKVDGVQYGSYFEDVEIGKTSKTGEFKFALENGAPEGEYDIYLYIKDVDTGAVVLVLQDGDSTEDTHLNIFQRIWNFIVRIFTFIGLS